MPWRGDDFTLSGARNSVRTSRSLTVQSTLGSRKRLLPWDCSAILARSGRDALPVAFAAIELSKVSHAPTHYARRGCASSPRVAQAGSTMLHTGRQSIG
jgi:hypothetical protein